MPQESGSMEKGRPQNANDVSLATFASLQKSLGYHEMFMHPVKRHICVRRGPPSRTNFLSHMIF